MSFTFNPTQGMLASGLGAREANNMAESAPYRGGLNISPQTTTSRRADFLTGLSLLLLWLGFFAATTLFVMALITVALA